MASYTDLLKNLTGPADAAVVLVAGTAGLVLDAVAFHVVGLPPGTFSVASASGALGLKKSWEAARLLKKAADEKAAANSRAEKAIKLLRGVPASAEADRLASDLQLNKDGLLSDEELGKSVDQAVADYRALIAQRPPHGEEGPPE
jgi:hypothetical protein